MSSELSIMAPTWELSFWQMQNASDSFEIIWI